MVEIFDVTSTEGVLEGLRAARSALTRGRLVVIPTDTVYGLAADAFTPAAVTALIEAKGRTAASPPPVLIPDLATLDALAEQVPDAVRALVTALWPGPLTVILPARSSLTWHLGETRGTVALRMPDDPVALQLLKDSGPLAVSSANRTGEPPATTAEDAHTVLGEAVEVILDAGPRGLLASTIVDATSLDRPEGRLRIVREGVVPTERIIELVAGLAEVQPPTTYQPESGLEGAQA